MRIIKEGNNKTEYIFDCPICECTFALSASEFAKNDGWGIRCPCCDNLMGKNDAFKDIKGIYSEKNLEKCEKKKIKFGDITVGEALNICSSMTSCSECPCEVTEDKTKICRLINTFNHKDSKYLEDEIEIEEK